MRLAASAVVDVQAVAYATEAAIADAHLAILRRARALARDAAQDAVDVAAGPSDLVALSLDERRAQAASQSLAGAWHDLVANPDVDDAVEALAPSIDRTAATEVWHAMNDETRRLADRAVSVGADITLTWWALGDSCDRCHARHGETVLASEGLTDWPPLHPRCRCIVLTEPA